MIEVYYSLEIESDALLYCKGGFYIWSDEEIEENSIIHYRNYWKKDEPPTVQDSPNVHKKLFEMQE